MNTEFYPVSDLDRIAERAVELSAGVHVYVAGGLLDGPKHGGRGSASDVTWIRQVNLDFDVGMEGHKTERPRPTSKDDVYQLLAALDPNIGTPTTIYDTGNGLLPVWQLEAPLVISCRSTRQRATQLIAGFQDHVLKIAKREFGWTLDRTSDLARLVRVAGTLNWKTQPPKPVVVFQ